MGLNKLLAIFDTDVLYASRLMEYLKKTGWDGFEILLFTKRGSLEEFLKYQYVDILLYGGDAIADDISKDNIKHIFFLCEDIRYTRDKDQMIYKYQAADSIRSDILSSYTRLEDKDQEFTALGDVSFITLFSPLAGVEKLSYAWSLAKVLSNKRKVLFVSFDLLPTAFMIKDENMGRLMSEFLYYLKESRTDQGSKLKSYLKYSEKLSYISGINHGFDLLSLDKGDIGSFIDAIKNYMDYDLVIYYLGIYTEASMEILRLSNGVYITICDTPYENLLVKEWERQMELTGVNIKELGYKYIKLPTGDRLAGPDLLPEKIMLELGPIVEELAQQILYR